MAVLPRRVPTFFTVYLYSEFKEIQTSNRNDIIVLEYKVRDALQLETTLKISCVIRGKLDV